MRIPLAAAMAAFFMPAVASAQMACGERAKLLDHLAAKYDEAPAHLGLTPTGRVVEVLTSPNGTWSLLVTHPNGLTCMLATGDAWEDIPRKTKPKGKAS